jgi:hypothetical protein
LLNTNVEQAEQAFRSDSGSFEQAIRALQGVREAVRQRLDARRAPDDVETRLVVSYPGQDPKGEGTPLRMRAAAYWTGVPSKFHDPDRYIVDRHIRLRFGVVERKPGDPPDSEVKVREIATGAIAWVHRTLKRSLAKVAPDAQGGTEHDRTEGPI